MWSGCFDELLEYDEREFRRLAPILDTLYRIATSNRPTRDPSKSIRTELLLLCAIAGHPKMETWSQEVIARRIGTTPAAVSQAAKRIRQNYLNRRFEGGQQAA